MKVRTQIVLLVLLAGFLVSSQVLNAIDFSGSARVYTGTTKVDDSDTDLTDQKYNFRLFQSITPWLSMRASYQYSLFDSSPEGAMDLERRSRQPRLELLYSRPTVSAQLLFMERQNWGSSPADTFDSRSAQGFLRWQPRHGPRLGINWRDDSNEAGVSLFGRDIESQTLGFDVRYDLEHWNILYTYEISDLENRSTGYSLDRDRHQLRVSGSRRIWDERLSLAVDGRLRESDQEEQIPQGTALAEPLLARAGLFALDTSPELGELDPVPELIDGDLQSPTGPRIEIGGASTYRNIGLDLGFTRPVDRLEISVDAPSDAGLLWQVYHSPDNLVWAPIGSVVSQFDLALLRYSLLFPETTNRYFKAVNFSTNLQTDVAVTEIRALLGVESLALAGKSTNYWLFADAILAATERVTLNLNAGFRTDQDLAEGRLNREFTDRTYSGGLQVELSPDLRLRAGYRFSDIEEDLDPVLKREEEHLTASLDWSPLETVNTILSLSSREESESGRRLRLADTARLYARTDLLPELRLISEVVYSDIEDPFSGFDQSSWQWRETIESQPTAAWTFAASLVQTWYDSTGSVALSERSQLQFRSVWRAAPFLTLSGDWSLNRDDDDDTVSQRYSISWNPGNRLAVSLGYQDSDLQEIRSTTGTSGSVNYRLNRKLTLYGSYSRSTTERIGVEDSEIESARLGFNLFF
jgi:opacity protein-like surface antigen